MEAGATNNVAITQIAGAVGNNGLVDALETVADNATIKYPSSYKGYALSGSINACTDSDNDGVLDVTDNCPLVSNANQLDYDNDGTGNACGDDVPMPGITGAISADKTGSSVAFAGDFSLDEDGFIEYTIDEACSTGDREKWRRGRLCEHE